MLEADWDNFIETKAACLPAKTKNCSKDSSSPLILYNDNMIVGNESDLLIWARRNFRDYEEPTMDESFFKARAESAYVDAVRKSGNKYCYFDLREGDEEVGRVVFELYNDLCPKTAKNFELLCTGEAKPGYKGSLFHRVVPGGWIQGGDISSGAGDTGCSASGEDFCDENFVVNHDRAGILSMTGSKRNANNSQFFVTFQAHSWLDRRCVAFGRVISGMRVLRRMETCKSRNQRPERPIVIGDCGLLVIGGDEVRGGGSSFHQDRLTRAMEFGEKHYEE